MFETRSGANERREQKDGDIETETVLRPSFTADPESGLRTWEAVNKGTGRTHQTPLGASLSYC